MKTKKKTGRPRTHNRKDVIINFVVTKDTEKNFDNFVKRSGYDNRSEMLRKFVVSIAQGNEGELRRYCFGLLEQLTGQKIMKNIA
jgi:metal-responsive CopG/Arc/MetJ family transcriptional regulator